MFRKDLRRAATHSRHFDRIVFCDQRTESTAITLLDALGIFHRRPQYDGDITGEVAGANRQHVGVDDVPFQEDGVIRRARTDVHQQNAHFALVLRQYGLGGSELLEHQLMHGDAGFVHASQNILVVRPRTGHDVDVGLQPAGGHAQRIVNAVLAVDDEFARNDVKQLELRGDVDRLRRLDDPVDVFARDLAMLPRDGDHATRIDRADVIAGDADVDRFDLQPGHDLSLIDGFLDRLDGLVKIDDVASPRSLHRRGALADDLNLAAVGHFPYQHAHLGSPDIERDDVFLFGLRHSLSPDLLVRDRR